MNKAEVIRTVRDRFATVGHGIDFEVIEPGVRQEDSWWYVPVIATRKGNDVPREITVNIFANIEDELETEERLSVLLVPATAETPAS